MTRLRLALAAAAILAVTAQTATAKADPPAGPPAAGTGAGTSTAAAIAIAEKAATASTAACVDTVMVVLDVLGLVEKGAPKGAARVHAAVRTPTWLQPEPPKTPLFYSSLVVAKF